LTLREYTFVLENGAVAKSYAVKSRVVPRTTGQRREQVVERGKFHIFTAFQAVSHMHMCIVF
jgi:hypothetical protein